MNIENRPTTILAGTKIVDNWIIEHDGLMVAEPTLEEAVESYGQEMFERGYNTLKTWANIKTEIKFITK